MSSYYRCERCGDATFYGLCSSCRQARAREFARDPHDAAAHDRDCPRASDDPAGMPCTCDLLAVDR